MNKKRVTMLLSIVLAFSLLFTGCSKPEEKEEISQGSETTATSNEAIANETTSESTVSAETQEEVTIDVYLGDTEENNKVIQMFEEANPNIKVNLVDVKMPGAVDYLKKMDILLLGGESVDVFVIQSKSLVAERAASGMIEPLDDYFSKEGIAYSDKYITNATYENVNYAIPYDVAFYMIVMNKKHLDVAGLEVPKDWTWAEYKEYAQKLTQGSGETARYGSYMHTWGLYNILGLWTQKNQYFKDDLTINFDDPRLKEWLEFRKSLDDEGIQMPFIEVSTLNVPYRDQMFNEKVSMMPMGPWIIMNAINREKYPHDFQMAFAPLPKWDANDSGYEGAYSNYLSIPSLSDHKEEAYQFIRFYSENWPEVTGSNFSPIVGHDQEVAMSKVMSEANADLIDVESLLHTFAQQKSNPEYGPTRVFEPQLEAILNEEAQKFLSGAVTIDEAINAAIERANLVQEEFDN